MATSTPSAALAFDQFQARTWTPLLLQTLALCGDLATAREALRLAYVDAWREWDRANRTDPEDFVRQRAWQRAQWRSQTRGLARSSGGLEPEQRRVTKALHALPLTTRKAIVLAGLSELSLSQVGRIIGETPERVQDRLAQGLTALMRSLDTDQDSVVEHLQTLEAPARAAARPAPASLRRRGRWRTLGKVAAGAALAVGVTVASGFVVYAEPEVTEDPPPAIGPVLTPAMLLTPSRLTDLAPAARWRTTSTSDNTTGDGINSPCQVDRFADPTGLKALVRTLDQTGRPARSVVQTVELSRTQEAAAAAYDTVVGWFAGCSASGHQLLSSYEVSGLGDAAVMLRFRAPGARAGSLSSYSVGVARAGRLVTWTGVRTQSPDGGSVDQLMGAFTESVFSACASRASGRCAISPSYEALPPPPSGEAAGMLAVTDLPPVGRIRRPWTGTRATPLQVNPAATSCDQADFVGDGARRTLSRTFLIPGAGLPREFGVTQTYGRFADEAAARSFAAGIRTRMDRCTDRQLSASISDRIVVPRDTGRSSYAMWRLDSEVRDGVSVRFWMGVAQVGSSVVQVTFVPSERADVDRREFRALVVRARDRLFELPATPRARDLQAPPSPSPSP